MEKEIMEERAVKLVSQHLERYPQMRIADVYKLIFQACMGAEHAITDVKSVEAWLQEEWESLHENPDEVLYEDLALHHPIYRINLKPAKMQDIAPSNILDAFVKCGSEFPKNPVVFRDLWEVVSRKIRAGKIVLPYTDDIEEFDELVRENDFPPIHHSKEYSEAYRPAYRLVGRPFD